MASRYANNWRRPCFRESGCRFEACKSEPGGSKRDRSCRSQSDPPRPARSAAAGAGLQQQGNCGPVEHQPAYREATLAHALFACWNSRWPQARETGHRHVRQGRGPFMTPQEHLTPREIQVAVLVWEGLTNREIGRIIGTSEQVIKNHLRSTFDKLGVWSRLELAMYVASHGGKSWNAKPGASPIGFPSAASAG